MNRQFIKEMCEAYYSDKGLKKFDFDKEEMLTVLYNEVINCIENLKIEDSEAYVSLNEDVSVSAKQNIIYSLLDQFVHENIDSSFPSIWNIHPVKFEESSSPEEYLSEIALTTLGGGVLAMTAGIIAAWKPLSRIAWNALKKLNALNKTVTEMVHKSTVSGKVKQTILVNNLDQCFKSCGIDPKKVSALAGFAVDNRALTSEKSIKQVRCLTKCYLDWTVTQVQFLAEAYINCLKGTGEYDNDINSLTVFLKQTPRGVCKQYYDILSKHRDEFRDVVSYIFRNDRDKLTYWYKVYDDALGASLSGKNNHRPNSRNNNRFNNRR